MEGEEAAMGGERGQEPCPPPGSRVTHPAPRPGVQVSVGEDNVAGSCEV